MAFLKKTKFKVLTLLMFHFFFLALRIDVFLYRQNQMMKNWFTECVSNWKYYFLVKIYHDNHSCGLSLLLHLQANLSYIRLLP